MGLETGWNTAVSLAEEVVGKRSEVFVFVIVCLSLITLTHTHHSSSLTTVTHTHHPSTHHSHSLSSPFIIQSHSLSDERLEWEDFAQLPHGISQIRDRLETQDNVPLLVHLFTHAYVPDSLIHP